MIDLKRQGYIQDPRGHLKTAVDHLIRTFKIQAIGDVPDSVDLEPHAPDVMDQGAGAEGTGSCVGHGFACGTYTGLWASTGVRPAFVPSPNGIYGLARALDRVLNIDGTLPPLTDDGAMPNQAVRAISLWGFRPIQAPTSDGRYSDCEAIGKGGPNDVGNDPTFDQLETSDLTKAVGAYAILDTNQTRITKLKLALANKIPVCIGAFVDTTYMNWAADQGSYPQANLNDPQGGGHEQCFLGYRPAIDGSGQTEFKIRNSWNKGWCDNGNIWVKEAFVLQASDLDIMTVTESCFRLGKAA